jgi:hypothetical protein
MPEYRQRDIYHDSNGTVNYLDAERLLRPFDPPKTVIGAAIVLAIVAAIIGGSAFQSYVQAQDTGSVDDAAAIEANLAQEPDLRLPAVADLVTLDNDTIKQTLTDQGYTYVDMSTDDQLAVFKVADGTDLTQATADLSQGFAGLDGLTASEYLPSAWQMTVERTTYTDLRVRYVDFRAGSADGAVASAISMEGWDNTDAVVVDDSGVDSAGNTYETGVVTTDTGSYQWRVSVCAFSDVYDIEGLPDTAWYVVISINA